MTDIGKILQDRGYYHTALFLLIFLRGFYYVCPDFKGGPLASYN